MTREPVRSLSPVANALPAGFAALRAEARAEGYGMLDTLAVEWASGAMRFDKPGEMLLSAYVDDVLAGIGGLTQETSIPSALRMRRFYVALAWRRDGVGRALAAALLQRSADRTVTCNAAAGSEPFWEALGFVPDRRAGYTHVLAR
jgi:GNAT superfamily N-acetyltransferase